MTDLADQLRPVTAEEWPRFVRAMSTTFGHEATGPYVDAPTPIAELDRSLVVPSAVALLGDRTWWLPRWLHRLPAGSH